jgi:hypothetical protein
MLGRHLAIVWNDINTAPPNTSPNPAALTKFHAQLPNVSSIGQVEAAGSSSYHSLQASWQRRYANGIAFDANYTLAHGLDNITGLSAEGGGGYGAAYSVRDLYPDFEYGNSDLDMRHRVAGNIIYRLPFGSQLKGIEGVLGKGWQLNLLTSWETGLPMSIVNSTVISNTQPGTNNVDRPNMIGNPRLSHPTRAQWFNVNAFRAQAPGTLGSERRNQVYGPHYSHVDFSILKDFPITLVSKEANLQFRAESLNLANHPSLGNPNTTLQSGSAFGTITSMNANYTPREIQFALKLQF